MILIDKREGSKDLIPLFGADEVLVTQVEFGDAAIIGNGPSGDAVVGIEVKTVEDMLRSMSTGRLAETQIPGMLKYYEPGMSWLLLIGDYRFGVNGRLEIGTRSSKGSRGNWKAHRIGGRQVPYGYLESYITEVQVLGIKVKNVFDLGEAAHWLRATHRWWSKPWSEHRGMHKFDQSQQLTLMPGMNPNQVVVAKFASQLPFIGWERAVAISKEFDSPLEMCLANLDRWERIPGIGRVIAKAALECLRGPASLKVGR